jgi:4-hydroxy-2-oxoheptanedioate aldolase
MVRKNPLKRRLAEGKKCLGLWLVANNAYLAEMVGGLGHDFVLIDHEHGPGDLIGAAGQLQAVRSGGGAKAPAALMRVPWNDPVYIKRALDIGVEGVMVPMIETAEQARAAAAACRFPPEGVRGVALGQTRASGFGGDAAAYWQGANKEVFVMLQIETPRAVEAISAIAAVPGVDALFIGPNDLYSNAGENPLKPTSAGLALLQRAEDLIRASGRPLASILHSGQSAQQMFRRGYGLLTAGSEVSVLRLALKDQIAAHREKNP